MRHWRALAGPLVINLLSYKSGMDTHFFDFAETIHGPGVKM
jgi:hypothetical protein